MRVYIDNWVALLRDADPAWGWPLMVLGLVLMFMGWNLHRFAVPFAFLLVGLIVGPIAFHPVTTGLLLGGVIGLILAIVSHFTTRYAVAVLGGLVGAFILTAYLGTFKSLHLPDSVHWIVAMFGFAGATALAFVMFREMAIVITSFIGALLLVSGLNGMIPQYIPTLYQTVTAFLADYPALFVPFLIGVPTTIGALTQLATVTKEDGGAM